MKVFISWSRPRSKAVAEALNGWLPLVIQAVEPWISSEMTKGIRSTPELAKRLEESKVGIMCLTRDNLKEPWILFEAGAISKTTGAYAFTFLLDITHGDVEYPLAQFQHTLADEADVRRLVRDINTAVEETGGRALPERNLNEIFDTFWPQLQAKLQTIAEQADQPQASTRPQAEVLEELLELVRAQDRRSRAQVITSEVPLEEGVAYVVNNGVLRRIETAWWQHRGTWELVELPGPGDSMRSEGASERETPAQPTGKNQAPTRVKARRPPRGGGPRT